jgi:hypothetical protein
MTRRGQASTELVLVAAAAAALAGITVRVAAGAGVDAGPVVRSMAVAAPSAPHRRPGVEVAAIAQSLGSLGIRETAANAGPWVDRFTDGHPEPWCADFVSWVLRAAGTPLTGGASGGWRVAGAGGLRTWFAMWGRWRHPDSAEPEAGDVVVFRHGHAGIVIRAVGGVLETAEGNAGDAVAIRAYPGWRNDPDIAGFGRP